MLFKNNIAMALAAIRSARWRSFLTMLGVIIGVLSVITTVSLAEGIKQQVVGQINQFGAELITVRPGRTVSRDRNGKITGINPLSTLGGSALNEQDLTAVRSSELIDKAVPFSLISSSPQADSITLHDGFVVATTEDIPSMLKQKVEFGQFFTALERNQAVAVIGKRVAERLFKQNVPTGRSFTIRGHSFVVRGVFEEFDNTSLLPGADYNTAIFIPFEKGREIAGDQLPMYQILTRPKDATKVEQTVASITESLKKNHDGQEDFTVLTQADNLALTDSLISLLTRLVAGIAAISLLVGGIGIMNIMLVSVSERTHEIGVRKAVGATNKQIAWQFVIEATVLSAVGGLIGVLFSLLANYFIRLFTNLKPAVSLPIIGASMVVAIGVGVFFGLMPALKAARKDPIESLRQA